MHTSKDIAERFGINSQTIRRWTEQYQPLMSASAYTGDARQFTDDDLLLLWSVRRWRQLGYSLDDIGERLGKGERASDPVPEAQTANEPPRALMIPETIHTTALSEIKRLENERSRLQIERDAALQKYDVDVTAFNVKINSLEREIGELSGKLTTIENERQPTKHWLDMLDKERRRWLVILAAAVSAAFLVAVVITAALLLLARQL